MADHIAEWEHAKNDLSRALSGCIASDMAYFAQILANIYEEQGSDADALAGVRLAVNL